MLIPYGLCGSVLMVNWVFDILPSLDLTVAAYAERKGIPTALRRLVPESLRWVPASQDGLIAPFLHRPIRHILPLKH